ncbi:MAG: FecR domain-containing protein [Alcanivoracaceae bacterium]|nr:FecR domain-containing protein [Alcanivoracaceae bacterium]
MKAAVLRLFCLMMLALPAAHAQAEDMEYTFRPGDSLWKVCEQFARDPNLCWKELAQRNGIASPRAIQPGTRLRIPAEWLRLQPTPARILVASGQLTVYRKDGGTPEPGRVGSEIQFGDALETGEQGYARIEFADGSWLLIRPSSLVVFDRYSQFRESGMVDTSLRLERGDLRTWVRPRRRGDTRFMIVTPSAMAAVRGTEFDVSVDADQVMRNEVVAGEVAVSSEGVEQSVGAGQATLARPGEAPLPPRDMLEPPRLSVAGDGAARASWPAVEGARRYRLALFTGADMAEPVGSWSVTGRDWQATVPPGDYLLVARAEDEQGLRGKESRQTLQVTEAPPAPEQDGWMDEILFVIGAAILLSL